MLKKIIVVLSIAIFALGLTGCGAEALSTALDPPEQVEGIVVEKEDYVVISTKNNHEVYYLTVKTEDGAKYKVRVTSVTFQQYNEGDKFNSHNHTNGLNTIAKITDETPKK